MDWRHDVRTAAADVDEWLVPRVAAGDHPGFWQAKWTATDVLGHLVAWSDLLMDEVEALQQDRLAAIEVVDVDAWNAVEVARRRNWTPDQMIADWRRAVQRADAVIASLRPETWERRQQVAWAPEPVSVADLLRLWLVHVTQHRQRAPGSVTAGQNENDFPPHG
ncbi:MAG: DinB family protein [Vicinamibacterales bacterium]